MNKLETGQFYGTHYQKSDYDSVIITDTEYTHRKVDWHYHENPYFTYLLQGKLFESNKQESYYLAPGSLLFHNWQDAHYNIKPPEYTRGFHLELNKEWFVNYNIQTTDFEGSMNLNNPLIKSLMNEIFIESKVNDPFSKISIETSLIEIFASLKSRREKIDKMPLWTKKLQELLLEDEIDYSLKNLSSILQIHPIHLSREFSRYFGTTLGKYIRLLKVNKAFYLLTSKKYSMTDICYECGFYDQSHFISCFKSIYKKTPTHVLREIS